MYFIISDYLTFFWREWTVLGDLVFNVHLYKWFYAKTTEQCDYKDPDHLFN